MERGYRERDSLQDSIQRAKAGAELESSLAARAMSGLKARALKLALAESCSGGLLSFCFTRLGGASEVLLGGLVCYDNAMKTRWLGVSENLLLAHGAVSEPVVRAMCKGALAHSGADIAIATSGIAGPSGGSEAKPVGSVYIAIQYREKEARVRLWHFDGERECVQRETCRAAIAMLESLLNSLDK